MFQSFTGVEDSEVASSFLKSYNWNVELAISSFLGLGPNPHAVVESPALNPSSPRLEKSDGARENAEKWSTTPSKRGIQNLSEM